MLWTHSWWGTYEQHKLAMVFLDVGPKLEIQTEKLKVKQKPADRGFVYIPDRSVPEGGHATERRSKASVQNQNNVFGLLGCDNIGCSNLLFIASIAMGRNEAPVEISNDYWAVCRIWRSSCCV